MADRHQTLDLRLLPAALTGWAVALIVVYSSAAQSMGWAMALTGCVLLSLLTALLVLRGDSRLRRVVLHMMLCAGVGAAVAFSAAGTQQHHEATGWNAVVNADVPVEVMFRVTRDSLPFESRGYGEESGYRSQAVVHTFGERQQSVRAEVMVFTESQLRAGHRYSALVSLADTQDGDRTTALLYVFGAEEPQLLPGDTWSEINDTFSSLRSATAQQSSYAVGQAPALLPGVVLGDRSAQSQQLTESMQVSGLTHMTVVSGTHCSLAMGALLGAARMMRLPRWCQLPLLIAGLLLFVMLVQPAPSVVRASIMGAIGALAVFAGRGRASTALLCLCVVLLLVYDPWYAVEAAFQLSVAATLGIVLIGARLKRYFAQWLPGFLAAALALAVSAQLFVTPVLLPIAEGVTLYSIPANILAAPLLPLATVPGTVAAVFSTSFPWFSTGLLWLAGFPAAGIAVIGSVAAALPQALVPWPQGAAGWAMAGLYCAGAILLCRMIIDSSARTGRTQKVVLAAAAGALMALILPATGILSFLRGPELPEDWRFAFCDVGQGDMLVIRTRAEAGIVVDAGEEPELAADCLGRLGITDVEILMVTHEHRDHYGGVTGVVQTASVEQILYSGSAGWSLTEAVEELDDEVLGVPEFRAQNGMHMIHEHEYPLAWQVWSAAEHHPNPNNNSLVVAFQMWAPEGPADAVGSANNPLRLLALGDLEEDAARLLLSQQSLPDQSHVLKVAHHGAANGGTQVLEHSAPSVGLIGVGEENSYGHPSEEILESLEDLGAEVYRTDLHSTVVFEITGESLAVTSVQ